MQRQSRLTLFYKTHRNFVLFNKNLVIADTTSLVISALFAEFYLTISQSNGLDAILTALVEYCIDTPLFFLLFWLDHRKTMNRRQMWSEIKKLFLAFSVCDVLYVLLKVFIQYQLLNLGLPPYSASLISSLVAWAMYFVMINVSLKAMAVYTRAELKWYLGLLLAISAANSFIFFSNLELRSLYDNVVLVGTAAIALGAAIIVFVRQNTCRDLAAVRTHTNTFNALAAGLTLWFAAELVWAYYIFGLQIIDPFPSEADILWLSGYGFFVYGIGRILVSLIRSERIRTDSVTESQRIKSSAEYRIQQQYLGIGIAVLVGVILVIVSYIGALALVEDNMKQFARTLFSPEFGISVAYPCFDIVLLVPTIAVLLRLRRTDVIFTHWILVGAFVIFSIIGDLGFAYSELFLPNEIGASQTWVWDTFFNSAYICMAAALLWYNRFIIGTLREEKNKAEIG